MNLKFHSGESVTYEPIRIFDLYSEWRRHACSASFNKIIVHTGCGIILRFVFNKKTVFRLRIISASRRKGRIRCVLQTDDAIATPFSSIIPFSPPPGRCICHKNSGRPINEPHSYISVIEETLRVVFLEKKHTRQNDTPQTTDMGESDTQSIFSDSVLFGKKNIEYRKHV